MSINKRPQLDRREVKMNVYDEVNNLAKAIKESKEYTEYKQIKQELEKLPELKKQVDEF